MRHPTITPNICLVNAGVVTCAFMVWVLAACGPRSNPDRKAVQRSGLPLHAVAGTVDSALPVGVLLDRFRQTLRAAPTTLEHGAPSRDSLVSMVVRASERGDAVALHDLGLSAAEFAYLYYPDNPQSRPPYDLSPQIMWLQLGARSDKGALRLLRAYGGKPLKYLRYGCDSIPAREGENRIWGHCHVTHRTATGQVITESLFAAIIERGGVYKILSFSNDL